MKERQTVVEDLNLNTSDSFVDSAERSIENALTMAIVSLSSPQQCAEMAATGNEFEKYLVRRRERVSSLDEFRGPIRG